MIAPTKLEVLRALVLVLDARAAEARARHDARLARAVTPESVLAAIDAGERTVPALVAFFPESERRAVSKTLDALDRAGRLRVACLGQTVEFFVVRKPRS